jgi:hypothetical protein
MFNIKHIIFLALQPQPSHHSETPHSLPPVQTPFKPEMNVHTVSAILSEADIQDASIINTVPEIVVYKSFCKLSITL